MSPLASLLVGSVAPPRFLLAPRHRRPGLRPARSAFLFTALVLFADQGLAADRGGFPSTPAARRSATSASLNPAAEPAVGQLDFGPHTRIDPRLIFDVAPSQTEAFGLGDGCAGFITPGQPDVVISAEPGLPQLMIYMVSDADGTLVVSGPDGRLYCNDDFEQLNPGVMIPNPMPGDYAVFAGTYSGTGGMATLGVTIASPQWVMDREH